MNNNDNLNDNPPKLTCGGIDTNNNIEMTDYRWISNEIDYSELKVKIRDNVYSDIKREVLLSDVLGLAKSQKHYDLCRSIAPLLYHIELYGYGDIDYLVFYKRQNLEPYRAAKRKKLPAVNYVNKAEQNQVTPNPLVVLDIDLKTDLGWLKGATVENFERKFIKFFNQENSAVFLYKSASGLGFHLGMAFTSNEINSKTYAKAYNFFAKRLNDFMNHTRFAGYIDYSVNHLNANFYLGGDCRLSFKNPTEALFIEYTEEIQPKPHSCELTENSFKDDFRLTHYLKFLDKSKTYFDAYDEWVKMIYGVVCAFGDNYDRAFYWFVELSKLSPKYDPYEDNDKFEAIFESEPEIGCGINYIIRHLFPEMKVSNYISYTFDELREYYEKNESSLKLASGNDSLLIDNHISELDGQIDIRENLIIESPPNSGKSTYFLSQDNIIFLAPTKVVQDDLGSNHPDVFLIKSQEDIHLHRSKYLGIYDSIYALQSCGLDLKKYTLIFDEKHEIFCSADVSFRHRVVNEIIQSLGLFNNVIFLTGSDIEFPFTNIPFKKITVRKREPYKPVLEFVSTDEPLETMVAEILQSPGKQVCFINNKAIIEKVEEMLVQKGRYVIVFSAETKGDEHQQEILKTNQIPPGTIILGTQLIIQGISFKDPDITFLRFYQPMLAEYVAQFSFRARKESSPPQIVMYAKTKDYKFQSYANLLNAYQFQLNAANEQFDIIEDLPRQPENDYQRYYKLSTPKVKKYLPIIKKDDHDPEIDLLFIGYLATKMASHMLAGDLLELMIQLLKWNFKFQFRYGKTSDLLKVRERETKEKQIEIIRNRFIELTYIQNITERQVFLHRAICALNWVDVRYFMDMPEEDRIKLFTDKERWKTFVVQVAVIANEKCMTEQLLENQICHNNAKDIINKIAKINSATGYPTITHPQLIKHLAIDSKDIKAVKKHIGWHYKLKNNPVNGDRSFTVKRIEHPFEQNIKWEDFEKYDDTLPL